jgi:hypothetical protein
MRQKLTAPTKKLLLIAGLTARELRNWLDYGLLDRGFIEVRYRGKSPDGRLHLAIRANYDRLIVHRFLYDDGLHASLGEGAGEPDYQSNY